MAAVWARNRAGLLAAALWQALPPVADASAAVHFAGQRFIARQAARDVEEVTSDVAALLRAREKRVALIARIIRNKTKQETCHAASELGGHYLMLSHAPLLREVSAGRTLLLAVAVVKH